MDRQQPDPITVNAIVDEALSKVDWTNRETLDIIVTIEMKPASLSIETPSALTWFWGLGAVKA